MLDIKSDGGVFSEDCGRAIKENHCPVTTLLDVITCLNKVLKMGNAVIYTLFQFFLTSVLLSLYLLNFLADFHSSYSYKWTRANQTELYAVLVRIVSSDSKIFKQLSNIHFTSLGFNIHTQLDQAMHQVMIDRLCKYVTLLCTGPIFGKNLDS